MIIDGELDIYDVLCDRETRFMPGEDLASALGAAKGLAAAGGGIVFTRLGENVTDLKEAQEVHDHYLEVIAEISRR